MMDKKKKLLSYDESNTFNTKIISKLKTDIYAASLWMKKILQLNVKLMHLMAAVQTNCNMFSDLSPVIVNMEGNIRMLHKANYVAQHVDFEEFPHLFKKGSDIYRDLLHQSCVPAKYAYYIMGLDTSERSFCLLSMIRLFPSINYFVPTAIPTRCWSALLVPVYTRAASLPLLEEV